MITRRDARPLALWSTPRTVSSAFDKMMRARDDHLVRSEPFSIPYYFGPDQRSDRFDITHPGTTFERVFEEVMSDATKTPMFVKEMAYQLGPLLRVDVLSQFRGSFLIRDPARALPSMARIWEDFTDDEAGYASQHLAWTMLRAIGEEPPIIDSDDLCADPVGVIGRWCDAVGIERRPDSLRWEPGMPDEWRVWESWMTRAAESTRFAPPHTGPPPDVDDSLAARIDRWRPLYAEMAHRCLSD